MNNPKFLIIHHEAPPVIVKGDRFYKINQLHKEEDFPISSLGFYCGYHAFIEKTGTLIIARKDDDDGAHTKGWNDKSYGVGLAGNFDLELPTKEQEATLKKLLQEKMITFNLTPDKIVPHRKFASKSCYGKLLTDTWASSLVSSPVEELQQKKISILKLIIQKLIDLINILKRRTK